MSLNWGLVFEIHVRTSVNNKKSSMDVFWFATKENIREVFMNLFMNTSIGISIRLEILLYFHAFVCTVVFITTLSIHVCIGINDPDDLTGCGLIIYGSPANSGHKSWYYCHCVSPVVSGFPISAIFF